MPAFDWNAFGVSLIQALIVPVTVLAFWAGRKVVTIIPPVALPIVVVLVASALDWLVKFTAGGVFDPLVGAALGAAAAWLYDFLKAMNESGLTSKEK